jgi:hypothetical protein
MYKVSTCNGSQRLCNCNCFTFILFYSRLQIALHCTRTPAVYIHGHARNKHTHCCICVDIILISAALSLGAKCTSGNSNSVQAISCSEIALTADCIYNFGCYLRHLVMRTQDMNPEDKGTLKLVGTPAFMAPELFGENVSVYIMHVAASTTVTQAHTAR